MKIKVLFRLTDAFFLKGLFSADTLRSNKWLQEVCPSYSGRLDSLSRYRSVPNYTYAFVILCNTEMKFIGS